MVPQFMAFLFEPSVCGLSLRCNLGSRHLLGRAHDTAGGGRGDSFVTDIIQSNFKNHYDTSSTEEAA